MIKISVKKRELPVTLVEDSNGLYGILDVDGKEVLVDFEDLPKLINNKLRYSHYIRVNGKFLPELLLNTPDFIFIDGNVLNNRRSNLKIVTKRKTIERKYDLDLPKYIYFQGETEERGEYFYIEIKVNGEYVFRKKTTQSRTVTREAKLEEAKSILVKALREHPEWQIHSELLNDTSVKKYTISHKQTFDDIELPNHVRYVKADVRGSQFIYEIRKPTRICIKSTSAKKISDKEKYRDLLRRLDSAGIVL